MLIKFLNKNFLILLFQLNHLKNNLNYENNPVHKIEIISLILF